VTTLTRVYTQQALSCWRWQGETIDRSRTQAASSYRFVASAQHVGGLLGVIWSE